MLNSFSEENPSKEKRILAIVIPVWNEEKSLPEFLQRLEEFLKNTIKEFETHFVFVNNGSTDSSSELLNNFWNKYPTSKILHLTRNFGYESALIAGLTYARGDYFQFLDADGEDPENLIVEFYRKILDGYYIAVGIRRKRYESKSTSLFRKLTYRIMKKVSDEPFWVDAGNFMMFRPEVRDAILEDSSTFPFIRGVVSRTGYRHYQLKYDRLPRIDGKSKYRKLALLKFAAAGFLTTTTWPLRYISYNSVATFLLLLVFNFLVDSSEIGVFMIQYLLFQIILSLSFLSMYLARTYKNQLSNPIFYIDFEKSKGSL
jgi:dolichol-phosphate mannosyltransferase